jgi:L-threonylcarbamoyladenylate synthase
MELLKKSTPNVINNAAKALKDGHLVAFPTETVYGLGADATNEKAVSRIYSVKKRPTSHPLIVHISSVNQINNWAKEIPNYAIKLATEYWPGPMTLILKKNTYSKYFITGAQDNVGLRVPSHPVALELLKRFEELGGHGIAAPSANNFGAVSPTSAGAVIDEIGSQLQNGDIVLDGGKSFIGIESTIIDCTRENPKVVRPGFITHEMIERLLEIEIDRDSARTTLRASGLFASHYAPKAKVILKLVAEQGVGLIALAHHPTPHGVIRLASPPNLEEFARDLYQAFRLADSLKLFRISVILPEGEGVATAIRDRLFKAASNELHENYGYNIHS